MNKQLSRLLVASLFLAPAVTGAQTNPEPSPSPAPPPPFKFSGDLRVRYERTSVQQPTSNPAVFDSRHREVVRFRAGFTKSLGDFISFGARVTTGDADDPNSTDITVGDFSDSFALSLDRAYMEVRRGQFIVSAGKFANPFTSTELVWDGDVHPQGLALTWGAKSGRKIQPRISTLLYLVDEQTVNPDSYMAGGQAQITVKPSAGWNFTVAAGYYDYTIKSLKNADAGDTRTNRLATGGLAFLSDFDLLDFVATFDHKGFGARLPVKVTGNYVRNLGATGRDSGAGVDLFVGRASEKGDLRFRYGYAQAETDAVLTAFSHDNTTLASNYAQHTFTVDVQLRKDLQMNATWYEYRRLDAGSARNPWIHRLRINALMTF